MEFIAIVYICLFLERESTFGRDSQERNAGAERVTDQCNRKGQRRRVIAPIKRREEF